MNKLDQKIISNLFSPYPEKVFSALNEIKEKGNEAYLQVLFDLLITYPEKEIQTEIQNLLGTIKSKESVQYFVLALSENKYRPILKTILIACWQNGLDFNEHLPLFTDLVITEGWEIAFEAFTVIENMEYYPDKDIAGQVSEKINRALETADDKKIYFLQEILKIIR